MVKPSNFVQKGLLRYKVGDATIPVSGGMRYILQVNNNEGKYGAGFSGVLSKKWPQVESEYRKWWREKFGKLQLGDVQFIQVQTDTTIVNMIAQDGIKTSAKSKKVHLKYDALETCLNKAGARISDEGGSVHMPRIGTGLAGGTWNKIEPIIDEQLLKRGINVTVYDLKEE